jgi:hypothetical protein
VDAAGPETAARFVSTPAADLADPRIAALEERVRRLEAEAGELLRWR